ncbi:MAG: hypothetical protein QHH09_01705 [Microgenomates group bacterium]|nr:hypothetical protein [Microgenomates group bacterium]
MAQRTTKLKQVLIFLIAVYFSLFFISPVLLTHFSLPKNTVNWYVGLYYPDYFEYLSFVKQGQMGNFFLKNLFSHEDNQLFIASWWPYPLLGMIWRYLPFLSLPACYWLASFILAVIYMVLAFLVIDLVLKDYLFIDKFLAFLFFLTAVGFYYGQKVVNYSYSLGSGFSRFSLGAPHHQVGHIFFIIGILYLAKNFLVKNWLKTSLVIFFLSLLLLFSSPPQLLLFWLVYLTTILIFLLKNWRTEKKINFSKINFIYPAALVLILIAPILFFYQRSTANLLVINSGKNWDLANFFYPPLKLFFLTGGLILLLSFLGLVNYFKKIEPARIILFLVAFFSIFFSLVPLNFFGKNLLAFFGFHNLRLASPASYLFYATASIIFLSSFFKTKRILMTAGFLIFCYFIAGNLIVWREAAKTPYQAAYLQFMPEEMYQGLKFLENNQRKGVVLTSPNSSLGVVVPAIAGRRVFFGRTIFTLDYDKKQQLADDFYQQKMTADQAKKFLQEAGISDIVATDWEINKEEFISSYPFLSLKFENSQLLIYAF